MTKNPCSEIELDLLNCRIHGHKVTMRWVDRRVGIIEIVYPYNKREVFNFSDNTVKVYEKGTRRFAGPDIKKFSISRLGGSMAVSSFLLKMWDPEYEGIDGSPEDPWISGGGTYDQLSEEYFKWLDKLVTEME